VRAGATLNIPIGTPNSTTLNSNAVRTQVSPGTNGQFNVSVPVPSVLPPGTQVKASMADGSSMPSWLSVDPSSGKVSGTPPKGFTGTVQLNVSVPQPDGSSKQVPLSLTAP
jgi:hypothetical protein